jgi:MFS family permease
MVADGVAWLFVARSVQGLATGLLLGAAAAALVDLHPTRDGGQAGLANGISSAGGIGLGAAVSGLLVQYGPSPEVTPFAVVTVLALVTAAAAWRLPETVAPTGSLALTPRMPSVPRALWRTFTLSALGVLAAWSVGGLYLSLGPGIVDQLLRSQNRAVGGLFVFMVAGAATLVQWLLRDASTRMTVVGGAAALAVGSVITAATVASGSLAGFLAGSVLVGLGFGGAFAHVGAPAGPPGGRHGGLPGRRLRLDLDPGHRRRCCLGAHRSRLCGCLVRGRRRGGRGCRGCLRLVRAAAATGLLDRRIVTSGERPVQGGLSGLPSTAVVASVAVNH